MRLLDPLFLLLLLAVPATWWWPSPVRDRVRGVLAATALALVALALARPVLDLPGGPEHHVVVLDRSASVSAEDRAHLDALAGELARGLGGARTTLVLVGPEAGAPSAGFGRVVRVAGAGGPSPLAAALAAALRAVPEGARGAVTLLTDGRDTAGGFGPAAEALAARRLPVHVVAAASETAPQPVGLEVPGRLRRGQGGRVRVHLAGAADAVDVVLRDGAGVLARADGVRVDGRATVTLEVEPPREGFLRVATEVVPSGRTAPAARREDLLAVDPPLRVLHVGGRVEGAGPAFASLVGEGFAVVEGDGTTPTTGFDVVVLDDVPADAVPVAAQESLAARVRDEGLGLLFAGGPAAFGPGGWADTPVAAILPVELLQREEKRDPSTTLVVIIDTSGSMGGERVQLAKEVARLAIRRLLPHDKVGIVEFYGAKRWAAPIQPASNAIEIQRALNRLQAGGGTVILPAIEEAFYGLQNVQTRYKHVLVLTDGGVERGAFEPLLRAMAEEGITVSTVLIGPEAHSEFLVDLANWGRGRFYAVPNRFNLPEVILKQPASARLPAWRPGRVEVAGRGGAGWWGPVDPRAVPPLAGYVETRARAGATTLLETATGGHPVLASWRAGLGRVTALTTEPTGPGTATWATWPGLGPLLARVLARTADREPPFAVTLRRRGPELVLDVVRRAEAEVRPLAFLVDGDGARTPWPLAARAPGHVQGRTVLDAATAARVEVEAEGRPDLGVVRAASRPHGDLADEAQADPRRALDLERLASATGGSLVAAASAAGLRPRAGGGEHALRVVDLAPIAYLLALLAFLAELLRRRWPSARVREGA